MSGAAQAEWHSVESVNQKGIRWTESLASLLISADHEIPIDEFGLSVFPGWR